MDQPMTDNHVDREILKAIDMAQTLRERLRLTGDLARTIGNKLLGEQPEACNSKSEDCKEGDIAQLHYCMKGLEEMIDEVTGYVKRLEQV